MDIKRLRTGIMAGAAGLLLVSLAACGGDDETTGRTINDGGGSDDPTATTAPAENGDDDANGENGDDNGDDNGEAVEEITVSMQDNFFEPDELTVPVGQEVTIVAVNDGQAIHNMMFPDFDFGSETMVQAGEDSSFEVIFEEAGTYDFQCDFHMPDMVGTITAE